METRELNFADNLAENLNKINGIFAKRWSSPDGYKERIYLNVSNDWVKKQRHKGIKIFFEYEDFEDATAPFEKSENAFFGATLKFQHLGTLTQNKFREKLGEKMSKLGVVWK